MSLNYDSNQAIAELSRADRKLGNAIRKVGAFQLEPQRLGSPFEALARAIVYQQLSGKAAGTILGRVQELFPGKRIRPHLVLAMNDDDLRGAGMSRNKVAAFRDLAKRTLDGTVPTQGRLKKMHDSEIIERLTQVRGIGHWTVEMLLMFHLGRPDVLPATDLGIRKGYMVLHRHREMTSPAELLALTAHWKPWRSVASWYFYRIADQKD